MATLKLQCISCRRRETLSPRQVKQRSEESGVVVCTRPTGFGGMRCGMPMMPSALVRRKLPREADDGRDVHG